MESTQIQLSVRVTTAEQKQIQDCVKTGYGLNVADFIRTAIREKIARAQEASQ